MMAPLSHVWLVLVTLIAVAEASAGDRDDVYLDCLDTCVEKLCQISYIREPPENDLTSWQRVQQRQLRRKLDDHLQAHHHHHRTPSRAHREPHPENSLNGVDDRRLHTSGNEGGEAAVAANGGSAIAGGNDGRRAGDDGTRAETAGGVERASGGDADEANFVHSPPWYLRAMGWDCVSECRYTCMTFHVETRIGAGRRVLQYYGKWPFRRVCGVQELFASLFSAGNGLPHLYHLLFSRGLYNPSGNYMQFWLTLYPWVGINTWLWSTVFHARDVRWTEAADYFCALLNIFFVVWVAIVRIAGPPRQRRSRVRLLVPVVGVLMTVYYLLHIGFMWFVKFDYGYNMKVALVAGVIHTALWLRYQYGIRDRHYARRGALIIILLNAAILLEVGDFPPVAYRLLDAHAIWHMVTIPMMFSWYRFVIQDARHEASLRAEKAT